MTLFLPQEIITFESNINFVSRTPNETGVRNGGTNSQIFLV